MGVALPDRAAARLQSRRDDQLVAAGDRAVRVGLAAVAALLGAVIFVTAVAPAAIVVAVLVPAAVVDVRERRIPDHLVVAAAAVLAVTGAVSGLSAGAVAAGAVVMSGPLLALHLISPASMGFGDVKAAFVLGAALGTIDWQLALVALCVAAGVGGVVGLARRVATIPFGAFLVFGGWAVVIGAALCGASR